MDYALRLRDLPASRGLDHERGVEESRSGQTPGLRFQTQSVFFIAFDLKAALPEFEGWAMDQGALGTFKRDQANPFDGFVIHRVAVA